jgi:hypothetical protein
MASNLSVDLNGSSTSARVATRGSRLRSSAFIRGSRFLLLLLVSLLLPATARAGIIRGHVRDAASGEPLASVVAALDGTDLGDLSGSNGYFLIADVPPGSYEIHFTAIGYDGYKQTVLLVGDTAITLDVRLATAPIPLKEVKVTAQKAEFKREVKVSSLTLSHRQLRTTPFVVESDLFRALQTLPGIVTTSDFSAASFVRGGKRRPLHRRLSGGIWRPALLGPGRADPGRQCGPRHRQSWLQPARVPVPGRRSDPG